MKAKKVLAAISLSGFAVFSMPASAAFIDNGLSSGTEGYWQVDALGGGQTREANITARRADTSTLTTTEVVFDYFTYIKVGSTAFQLSTVGGSTSSGSFAGQNGLINWSAVSSIAAGSSIFSTAFSFSSDSRLGDLQLFQYLDEDVEGGNDDVFFTRGSAALNNLQLYTIDNAQGFGVSHGGAYSAAQGLVNSSFAGWAVDNYNDMKPRLLAGTQAVSLAGVIEAGLPSTTNAFVGDVLGPRDIVSVMAWTVDSGATSSTIVTTLGGVPDVRNVDNDVPEPATLALAGIALAGMGALRRRKSVKK